ncbi:MAG TPA: hypothetical protein VNN18_00135 [Candidatus Xenobia bacterium]|nr:hypothetical protein [Candidatus Xenobia bacterium]
MKTRRVPPRKSTPTCEHGLKTFARQGEQVCALEYLNRFVAPRKVERLAKRGKRLWLVFDSGEKLECCCEQCGESHGDDPLFTQDIEEVSLGRRAMRFRLEDESGNLVVWFARGDHLHLHRNSLLRFQPPKRRRAVRPAHTTAVAEQPEGTPEN